MQVFVSRKIPEEGLRTLERAGVPFEVNPDDRVLSPGELASACRDADGLLCLLTDRIDRNLLDAAPSLRGIACMAVGHDNVDLAECTRRGIPVSNTPGVLTEATADLAWALLLAAARNLNRAERFLRKGKFRGWSPTLFLGAELAGKTLGIVGAGRIGTAVARRAAGFGLRIVYASRSPRPDLERELGAERLPLEALLKEADFVTLHVPLTPETEHLIDRERLALMKPDAVLVNTSRGPVVDEGALAEALNSGRLGAAGLDVFEEEPAVHPALLGAENAVLLPHIGSATRETRGRMAAMAAENLCCMLAGRMPPNCLNPEALGGEA
ncbi:MAG TPA: D-glycerate dehydrogenase [bacterium]|nr:D-glycerate dehydrogenase [bacterium]HPQ66117.1 D-glycerate dehydrogenase [bacterium]